MIAGAVNEVLLQGPPVISRLVTANNFTFIVFFLVCKLEQPCP